MKNPMDRVVPAWAPEPVVARLQDCRILLALWGCLTEAENERVRGRIAKLPIPRVGPSANSHLPK